MDKFVYPNQKNFKVFIKVLEKGDYAIKKYLPPINSHWYFLVADYMAYVKTTAGYEENLSL